jgi:hypothetical protein
MEWENRGSDAMKNRAVGRESLQSTAETGAERLGVSFLNGVRIELTWIAMIKRIVNYRVLLSRFFARSLAGRSDERLRARNSLTRFLTQRDSR